MKLSTALSLALLSTPPANAGFVQYQCSVSHASFDDPIAFPGSIGAAHKHIFWGNTNVNANTIGADLVNKLTTNPTLGSTCIGGGSTARGDTMINKSSYWVAPIVGNNDATLLPTEVSIRYLKSVTADLIPFPEGLTLIAGDGAGTTSSDTDTAYFQCGNSNTRYGSIPQDCRDDVDIVVLFQDCWDGEEVNWFAAKGGKGTHMTYSSGGSCPSSHPNAIPQVRYTLTFPNTDASGLYLASDRYASRCDGDGGFTVHADFMNGWDSGVIAELVEKMNDTGNNVNVRDQTSAGRLQQGQNRATRDSDGSLSNNEVKPKCGCSSGADLSMCSIGGGGGGGEKEEEEGGADGEEEEEEENNIGLLKNKDLVVKVAGGLGGALFLLLVYGLYARHKGTYNNVISAKHRKGKSYKGSKMGSVKGKWPPTSEMV